MIRLRKGELRTVAGRGIERAEGTLRIGDGHIEESVVVASFNEFRDGSCHFTVTCRVENAVGPWSGIDLLRRSKHGPICTHDSRAAQDTQP